MNATVRKIRLEPAPRPDDYLGPARVVAVEPHAVHVELGDGSRSRARLALAFPYAPEPGDELLVIGKGDEHYVIGVLHGTGTTALSFPGTVDLRAEGGPLRLSSDRGVSIQGPALHIEAGKLAVVAGAVVQTLDSLCQRVRGALSVHARRTHTVVEERSLLTAKDAAILTEDTMSINGREIHLG